MTIPLVSIIIPVFNSEKYLAETVNSALAQTWPNKEIIIVDDGSSDQSAGIAREFDNKVVKIIQQQNKGASAARNKGLFEAKGKYIQFLDADDLLSPDKISQQVTLLEKNPDKIAICSTIHFYDGLSLENSRPSPYEELFLFSDEDPVHFLINLWGGYTQNGSMVAVHSWLSPKHIIDKAGLWNEELNLDDDGEFFCRVVLNSKGIIKSSGFNYYRKYSSQLSLSSQKNITSLTSRIKAAVLKKGLLLSANNSIEAQTAIYKSLINIAADSYVKYPEIYKKAVLELPKIKLLYRPALGGPISNKLSVLFGWRTIKFLKAILNFYK